MNEFLEQEKVIKGYVGIVGFDPGGKETSLSVTSLVLQGASGRPGDMFDMVVAILPVTDDRHNNLASLCYRLKVCSWFQESDVFDPGGIVAHVCKLTFGDEDESKFIIGGKVVLTLSDILVAGLTLYSSREVATIEVDFDNPRLLWDPGGNWNWLLLIFMDESVLLAAMGIIWVTGVGNWCVTNFHWRNLDASEAI